jgi:hypothetical protein
LTNLVQSHKRREIAEDLNWQGVPSSTAGSWTRAIVHHILINPKYIGTNIYNRKSFKLKQRRVVNPEAMWVRKDNAFQAIVSRGEFTEAVRIIQLRSQKFTDEEILEKLSELLAKEGRLSGILIDEFDEMPSSSVYKSRFGSLIRAYSLVGYTPERDFSYIETNRALRTLHAQHVEEIKNQLMATGAVAEMDHSTGVLTINGDFTAALVIARCHTHSNGRHRWLIRLERSHNCDITIAARMAEHNQSILDYYLFPKSDELNAKIRLWPENPLVLEVYRFENLNLLYAVSRRIRIGDAA